VALLSGAEGLSRRSSMGTSSRLRTIRAERTVITFLALPSMVMEKTTRTGGSAENWRGGREERGQGSEVTARWLSDSKVHYNALLYKIVSVYSSYDLCG